MLNPYKIPLFLSMPLIIALGIGQFLAGTPLYFVGPALVAVFFAVCTYNALGGLSRFSGIIFANFALRNIVISQIAKVILWEPAQKNLESPGLTISIYAVFYFFAYIGV